VERPPFRLTAKNRLKSKARQWGRKAALASGLGARLLCLTGAPISRPRCTAFSHCCGKWAPQARAAPDQYGLALKTKLRLLVSPAVITTSLEISP
jgi:hypothetical protein